MQGVVHVVIFATSTVKHHRHIGTNRSQSSRCFAA
jgi:hypothetical protein